MNRRRFFGGLCGLVGGMLGLVGLAPAKPKATLTYKGVLPQRAYWVAENAPRPADPLPSDYIWTGCRWAPVDTFGDDLKWLEHRGLRTVTRDKDGRRVVCWDCFHHFNRPLTEREVAELMLGPKPEPNTTREWVRLSVSLDKKTYEFKSKDVEVLS